MTARIAGRGLGTRVFGIDVRLDPSWGIIAALVAALLALRVFPDMLPDARPAVLWAMAVVTVAGIDLSIVLHELGHTLAARGFGIGVRAITLFLFGGVALLEREARTPSSEFLIAIAGPAVSVGLALLFAGAAGLPGLPAPAATVFSYLRCSTAWWWVSTCCRPSRSTAGAC
jgi:Zn-dependent proteases